MEMMNSIPYCYRIVALLVLAVVLVLHDMRKGSSGCLMEYGCLFLVGIIGAVYGAANDAITVRISPDYFALGKGLTAVPSLTSNAIRLGGQAGFSAAAIACAVWLFALRRAPVPHRCRLIATNVWQPFAAAIVLSVALLLLLNRADPLQFSQRLDGIISPSQIASFITVWWIHTGAYLGLCAGLAAAMLVTGRRINERQNIMLEGSDESSASTAPSA
jgi:hypothetical protein